MRIGKLGLAISIAALLSAVEPVRAQDRCTLFVKEGHVPLPGRVADGRSLATAFSRIGAAAREVNNPGEVICVGPGTYEEGNITPGWYGTEGAPIVFLADTSGALTDQLRGRVEVVMPPQPSVETVGFILLGHHDVIIDGFTVRGFSDAGIQVRSAAQLAGPADLGNSHDVTLRNNEVVGNDGAGIDVSAAGLIVIENNRVSDNGGGGISIQSCAGAVMPMSGEQALDPRCAAGPSESVVPQVSNNRVGRNGSDGLFLLEAKGAVLQNNVVFSNAATGVTLRSASDCLVVNNLVYDNDGDGLAVGTSGMGSPNTTLLNNDLYGNRGWGLRIGGTASSPSPGAIVLNNIITRNGSSMRGTGGIGVLSEQAARYASTCGYVAGFNIVSGNQDGRNYGPETPFNVYDLKGDPELVDPDGSDGVLGGDGADDDDFRLRFSSPGRDGGTGLVATVGLYGSTTRDAQSGGDAPDFGTLDVGYHYAATPHQQVDVPAPVMPLYVGPDGDDGGPGKSPREAFRSIGAAALRARAGVSVRVAAGVYRECDLGPPANSGVAEFIADIQTFGSPVVVDASCCGAFCEPGMTAFNILRACAARVQGFRVTGAVDAGIQVQGGSHGAVVRDNVASGNLRLGIQVVNSDDVEVVNNLVHGNGSVVNGSVRGGGIQVGSNCSAEPCLEPGSDRAVVESNTCFANGVNGILIGAGAAPSRLATVRYNILQANGENGIQLGSNDNSAPHLDPEYALRSRFNVNADGYGAATPRGFGDLVIDRSLALDRYPLFVDAANEDFHLQQRGAGQLEESWAVDYADISADQAGMSTGSTRTDFLPDMGRLDIGYHYPACASSNFGDCDADGRVSVSDLVIGVRVALAEDALVACPRLDRDEDGGVSVDELVLAVRNALVGCV